MNKFWLTAGAAALAIAMPAAADPGKGGGKGHGGHGAQQAGHGGDHGKSMKVEGRARGNVHVENHGMREMKSRGPDHSMKAEMKARGIDRDEWKGERRVEQRVRVLDRRDDGPNFPLATARGNGLYDGCPPGLAMKDNGCMPPGQAKKVGTPLAAALREATLSGPYRQWYRDDDRYLYRMGDGVIYRVNRSDGLIGSLIPYGVPDYSYYPVGYNYPSMYNSYNIPLPYQGYYPDGGDYLYRYGGNAIYAVDPKTQLVSSIVSLLAGDLGVGQPLPSAYNVYNVPLAYRSQYYDTADNWYRYNDGYIYRVDPTTQLITAVIDALV